MIKIIQNHAYMLKRIFRYTPGYAVWQIFNVFLSAAVIFLSNTYIYQFVTSRIMDGGSFWVVAAAYGVLAIVMMAYVISDCIFQQIGKRNMKEKYSLKLQEELYQKASQVPLSYYDDPKYYNDFIMAGSQAKDKAVEVLDAVTTLLNDFLVALFHGMLFIALDVTGILFIAASIGLSFLLQSKANKAWSQRETESKPLQRECSYIQRVFYLQESAKEIRLFSFAGLLMDHFQNSSSKLIQSYRKTGKKLCGWNFINAYFGSFFIFFILYLGILIYRASVIGDISAAEVLVLFLAVDFLSSRIMNIIYSFGTFHQLSFYIDKLRSFLKLDSYDEQNHLQDLSNPFISDKQPLSFRLENVSFRYEKNPQDTLKNVSLTITPGERIAIVGRNGSGKTTFIKLLTRLYQPTQGEIYLGNIPIRQLPSEVIRETINVLFQDVYLYSLTLQENVSLCPAAESVNIQIADALQKSGLDFSMFPKGLNTQLTREFSDTGLELSGGERQKVVLARHYYSQAPVKILDEPLSSLDPIAEKQFCDQLLEEKQEDVKILTSHRLACACLCDHIYYLENGEILEHGTHEELMDLNGRYAELYRVQAEKFEYVSKE